MSAAPVARAQDAARFFDDNCAMCHTIGGGAQGAPDLKDATRQFDRAWLIQFMVDPEGMSTHDRSAAALIEKWEHVVMPKIDGLTPERAAELLRYIDEKSGGPAAAAAAPAAEGAPSAADAARGREIYVGTRRLSGGGAACISCHRLGAIGALGGGTLGPDLTGAAVRLGGARGLHAWLSNPPTRVMRAVFRPAPLSADENAAIVALLADQATAPASPRPTAMAFLGIGAAGTLVALALFGIVWTGRFRAARRPTIARARLRALEARDE